MSSLALPVLPHFELFPDSGKRSGFAWAIAASLLVHALALGWLPGLQDVNSLVKEPLRVLLAPLPAPEKPRTAVLPAPTFPREVPNPQTRKTTRPEPVREVMPLTRAPTETPSAAPAIAVAPTPVAPPPAVEPAAPPAPAVPRVSAPDPLALAAYGKHLAGAVAAHQRYPRLALMRQWQGTTLLQLQLDRDGGLTDVRVLNSSGHEILDKQAIDMVRAALPLPPLPASLSGRALTVDVPVVFRLAS